MNLFLSLFYSLHIDFFISSSHLADIVLYFVNLAAEESFAFVLNDMIFELWTVLGEDLLVWVFSAG